MLSATRCRAGFTLLEVVVVLAILGVLAGVLFPQLAGRTTQGQAANLASNLDVLADAIQTYRGDVNRYPSRLTYLPDAPPASGATDACGRPLPPGLAAAWGGPYLARRVNAAGIPSGSATIRTTLRRVPANASGGSNGTLFIDADDVDLAVADILEAAIDGNADLTGGSLVWQPAGASGRGTVSFAIPVRGC